MKFIMEVVLGTVLGFGLEKLCKEGVLGKNPYDASFEFVDALFEIVEDCVEY